MTLPTLNQPLSDDQIKVLDTFTKACRSSIIQMTTNASSGHPGGSLSTVDYLALLYTMIISQTGEKVVVSHGHVSPAVYSVLAEMGYIDKEDVVKNFRKIGSKFEGHVTRHVPGVWYGTGPLGVGVSAACGFAIAEEFKESGEKVYALMGDGETQEGQVYEMAHLASKYDLDNFILWVDYNKVQLTASLDEVMPIDIEANFEAAGWHVINADGHDFQALWGALGEAHNVEGKPVVILGHSVMGQGVGFMQETGEAQKADWHGKAASQEQITPEVETLTLTDEENTLLDGLRQQIKWHPEAPHFPKLLSKIDLDAGEPVEYEAGTVTDCRSAYGKALHDLAHRNKNVIAVAADLMGSVMTKFVAADLPHQHIEVGIAEQNMVSVSGGLSLAGQVPFCSTFGAFMTSRAKDQARVNDINQTNVKMVATHCGLSVGEDGPTHQAIDDMGSFLGFYDTMIIEPADANQCDRIIRYVASHYGNCYVRMGRHKFEVLTKEDGSLLYDKNYVYEYGKTDIVREGSDVTIAATGAMVSEALKAHATLKEQGINAEVVAVSSIKKFDETVLNSVKKTKKLVTVEDHNTRSGLGSQLARELMLQGIQVDGLKMVGTEEYQLSGKWNELYESAKISAPFVVEAVEEIV